MYADKKSVFVLSKEKKFEQNENDIMYFLIKTFLFYT